MAAAETAAGRDAVQDAQDFAGERLAALGAGGFQEDSPGAGVFAGQLSLNHPYFARLTSASTIEQVYLSIRGFIITKLEQGMAHETRMNEFAYQVAGHFQGPIQPGGRPFSAQVGANPSYMNRVGGHVQNQDNLSPYRMNSVQVAMLSMLKGHFDTLRPLFARGGVALVTYEYLATNSVKGTLDLESRFSIAAHWVTFTLTTVSEFVAQMWGVSVRLLNSKLESEAGEIYKNISSANTPITFGSAGAVQSAASKASSATAGMLGH